MPVIFRAWVGGECSAQITPVRLVRECLDRIDYGCLFSLLLLSYIMLFSIGLVMVLEVSRAAPHVQCAIRYFLSLFWGGYMLHIIIVMWILVVAQQGFIN